MAEPKNRVIVALDVPTLDEASDPARWLAARDSRGPRDRSRTHPTGKADSHRPNHLTFRLLQRMAKLRSAPQLARVL